MKAIAWAITGSGVFINESLEAIRALRSRNVPVTVFVSRAGEEVLKMYGMIRMLEEVVRGGYPNEVVYERDEGHSFPRTGRLYKGVYSFVVVSPATINTVAKIVHGIADSLVSNLVSHAIKTGTPVLVVPSDLSETTSRIPLLIDRDACESCSSCVASTVCPTGALSSDHEFKVRVDLLKCTLCELCARACPYGAIKLNVEIRVKPHPYYVGIIKRLTEIPGVAVLENPGRVLDVLRERGVYA